MELFGGIPTAYATVRGDEEHPDLYGTVRFVPGGDGTLVIVEIKGLPESESGFFGMHIHEGENCTGEEFPNTGGHYNPEEIRHPEHAGDLPPLLNCHGKAYLSVLTDRFRIRDIIGRTLVIHSEPDDFRTQPSGASGEKIGCGIICRIW